LSGPRVAALQCGVYGYAGAEEWCCFGGVETVWNGGYIVCGSECVLLECSWGVVAGDFLVEA
jgi:hypothetical protein